MQRLSHLPSKYIDNSLVRYVLVFEGSDCAFSCNTLLAVVGRERLLRQELTNAFDVSAFTR
jgi:hypothetical protein